MNIPGSKSLASPISEGSQVSEAAELNELRREDMTDGLCFNPNL